MSDNDKSKSDEESLEEAEKPPVVAVKLEDNKPATIDQGSLDFLPPEAQQAASKLILHRQSFSGPIPPPEILIRYDEALPGAMDRIIKMAESQQRHDQTQERKAYWFTFIERALGQVFGLTIGLSVIALGAYTVSKGDSIVGGLISFTGLASLVGVFVYGRRTAPKSDDDEG